MEPIVKTYAAPGIDSTPEQQGVYNSGAGLHPDTPTTAVRPTDPSSRNPVWGRETGRLIGNYSETQAPDAKSLRIRKRGDTPWGGFDDPQGADNVRYDHQSFDSRLNVGGSVDHDAGASDRIAGGKGAASSMVRVNGAKRHNEGQKLPILPDSVVRGAPANIPGGGYHGMPAAPLTPKLAGLPSVIFKPKPNPAGQAVRPPTGSGFVKRGG